MSYGEQGRLLVFCNLTGLPGLAVPADLDDDGLPVGVQVVGPLWSEMVLLEIARELEQAGILPGFQPPPGLLNAAMPSRSCPSGQATPPRQPPARLLPVGTPFAPGAMPMVRSPSAHGATMTGGIFRTTRLPCGHRRPRFRNVLLFDRDTAKRGNPCQEI